MQNEKLSIRIFAGVAFLLSLIVYLRTIAPTVSFWDCGEFIACSHILGIPHPPGAPFYLLIGRLFSMLPLASDIGLRVNIVSALSTAITVMLTFLIIVRLIKQWRGEPKDSYDLLILVVSGMVGALTFAFTDTLWFNAVEAEVYAISMVFTSLIVWLILVWLEKSDTAGNERYIMLIFYLVGLAIGVHLLMVLALPAIFMVIYFRKLEQYGKKMNLKNLMLFGVLTLVAFAAIYPGVVQGIPNLAGSFGIGALVALVVILVVGLAVAIMQKRQIISLALICVMLVLTGYSTYLMIPIRSGLNPAIDENDPETIEGMVKYLNREQYGTWGTFPRRFPGITPDWQFERQFPNQNYKTFQWDKQMDFMFNYQLNKMYWRYFGWQFIGKGTTIGSDGFIAENISFNGLMGLPFLLGLLGMFHHFRKDWRHASSILALFVLTGAAIVIYLNQENPQPRERDYVYVGSYFAFAAWIGVGASAILESIKEAMQKKSLARTALTVAIIAAFTVMGPVNLIAHNYESHDRTGNYVAYDYSYNILQTCEKDAVIFTNGDNDTFPLWFLQYVYDIRPDVRVVNLSLLNTPWYIKQLKHEEPKVPITISDRDIDKLQLVMWETKTVTIPVSEQAQESALADIENKQAFLSSDEYEKKELQFQLKPTVMGQALRIQDMMILNIIMANNWERPIYFAVTVSNSNQIGLNNFLRMDGLDFKLVPYNTQNGAEIASDKLEKNLFEVFQFRNLDNPDVYYNDNIVGLLQNYRSAFMRLATSYQQKNDYKGVVRVLRRAEEVLPFDVIPATTSRLPLYFGQLYELAGEQGELMRLGEIAYEQYPKDNYVVGTFVSLLERAQRFDEAITVLKKWQKEFPADTEAQKKIDDLSRLVTQPDSMNN